MITYELSLERQNLLGADRFSIAAQSNETVSFRFHFDRSWRIFDTKAAVFKSADGKYYVLDIVSGSVTVPWEVLRSTRGFELAVVAYENEVVLTSKKVRIAVSSSLLPENCRQLSPSETLFDRLRTEALNAAFLQYRDEIQSLEHAHANEKIELGEQIEAERSNTAAVTAQKNAEIEALNYQASVRENELQSQIAELQEELAAKAQKAADWDLIDTALSQKTSTANPLWGGGTEPFELPMLNTSSITSFTNSNISANIAAVGFDMTSATSFSDSLNGKTQLTKAVLKNTENVSTFRYGFCNCIKLKTADIGNPVNATSLESTFNGCKSLEYVSIGHPQRFTTMNQMFSNCRALKEIDGLIDASLCQNFTNAFASCSNLETITFEESTIRVNIDLSACAYLSKESIYSIANGLSEEVSATITLSEHALSTSLTAAEKSEISELIRTTKGWTLLLD